jgi:hypothetical protein
MRAKLRDELAATVEEVLASSMKRRAMFTGEILFEFQLS